MVSKVRRFAMVAAKSSAFVPLTVTLSRGAETIVLNAAEIEMVFNAVAKAGRLLVVVNDLMDYCTAEQVGFLPNYTTLSTKDGVVQGIVLEMGDPEVEFINDAEGGECCEDEDEDEE